jgi:hypothetical protein
VNSVGRALDEQLFIAVKQGETERAVKLINSGANINAKDECGYTCLEWAAAYAKEEIIEMLLKKGADDTGDLMSGFLICQSAFSDKIFGSLIFELSSGAVKIASELLEKGVAVADMGYVEKEALASAVVGGFTDGKLSMESLEALSKYPGMRFIIIKALGRRKKAAVAKKKKKKTGLPVKKLKAGKIKKQKK